MLPVPKLFVCYRSMVFLYCFLEISTYLNIILDSSPKLFIKNIFSHAKKLKDIFFLDLVKFCPYLLYLCVCVCVSSAEPLKIVCRYCDVHLLSISASPEHTLHYITTLLQLRKLTRISYRLPIPYLVFLSCPQNS